MSKIEIYTRDEQGLITYHGDTGWYSREQVLEYYFRADEIPVREKLLGWAHPAVTWYGNIGFGEQA